MTPIRYTRRPRHAVHPTYQYTRACRDVTPWLHVLAAVLFIAIIVLAVLFAGGGFDLS